MQTTVFESATRPGTWFWLNNETGRHGWAPTWELAEIEAAYHPDRKDQP
jgi:hypothetical protein